MKGKGQSLDIKIRDYFQPGFGVDLTDVRVHTDLNADRLARAINARAFTLGNDVVFAKNNPVIQDYNDVIYLNDLKTNEAVRFKYVSFPYSLKYIDGPLSCHIKDQILTISRRPDIPIKIAAELIVEYADCSRSGRVIKFCEKLSSTQKERKSDFPEEANIKKPLLSLYLETQEK